MTVTSGATLVVATKEFMEHLRTKRLLILGFFYLAALVLGLLIGLRVTRDVADVDDRVVFVLGFYFGLFPIINGVQFTSALGIMLSADAIVGEWKDRTLFLLLSKPVTRNAVLAGKILGAFLGVFSVFAVMFVLGLIVVLSGVGVPGGTTFGQIVGGFLLVAAGIVPFIGLGILCSVVFRTPTASFLVAFGSWFLFFPLLGNTGLFIRLLQRTRNISDDDALVQFFHHLDPKWLMDQGATYMLGGRTFRFFENFQADVNVPLVLVSMAAHTIVFLGLSFLIVNRRDYA